MGVEYLKILYEQSTPAEMVINLKYGYSVPAIVMKITNDDILYNYIL